MKKRIGKAAGTWARHLQKDRKLQRAANKIIREESRHIERTVKSENINKP